MNTKMNKHPKNKLEILTNKINNLTCVTKYVADRLAVKAKMKLIILQLITVNTTLSSGCSFLVLHKDYFVLQLLLETNDHYTQATLKLFRWKLTTIMNKLSTECV